MYVVALEDPLRKCPTCGARPVLRRDGKKKYMICTRCHTQGRMAKSVTGAVRRWNNEIVGD